MAAGTIEPRRAAVIRGRVLDRADNPLPGVTLSIKDHPELGQVPDFGHIVDQTESRRADHDAGDQETGDRAQAHRLKQRHRNHCGAEHHDEIDQVGRQHGA